MRLVTVVFAGDYSEKLDKLAFRAPVWIVDTPANRSAAEEALHAAVEWPHMSITLFRFDDWRTLLEQISFQQRGVDTLDVIGSALTLPARAMLSDAGFTRFDETAEGFRARKP